MNEETIHPAELIVMSVQLGIDMTPEGDLEERFDAFIQELDKCSNELDQLLDRVNHYATTVQGFDKAEYQALTQDID